VAETRHCQQRSQEATLKKRGARSRFQKIIAGVGGGWKWCGRKGGERRPLYPIARRTKNSTSGNRFCQRKGGKAARRSEKAPRCRQARDFLVVGGREYFGQCIKGQGPDKGTPAAQSGCCSSRGKGLGTPSEGKKTNFGEGRPTPKETEHNTYTREEDPRSGHAVEGGDPSITQKRNSSNPEGKLPLRKGTWEGRGSLGDIKEHIYAFASIEERDRHAERGEKPRWKEKESSMERGFRRIRETLQRKKESPQEKINPRSISNYWEGKAFSERVDGEKFLMFPQTILRGGGDLEEGRRSTKIDDLSVGFIICHRKRGGKIN